MVIFTDAEMALLDQGASMLGISRLEYLKKSPLEIKKKRFMTEHFLLIINRFICNRPVWESNPQ
ncbi:MAG: hypothetical protein MR444_00165, partial [Lachnospiraceae bacterium]|nr:hypothetical protein [Lachnospiraceae bacterium]